MKLFQKDLKKGIFKLKPETKEDLWYLKNIIEPKDLVSGFTERKIKIGGSDDKSRISLRRVNLKIAVDSIDLNDALRISGKIVEAPDDIPKGDFHTIVLPDTDTIILEKQKITTYLIKKIDESLESNNINILIVAFDREDAIFALLKNSGYETLLELKGDVSKKDYYDKKSNFYLEIFNQILEYDSRYNFSNIVVASPAFWKDYLLKEAKDNPLTKKFTLATCSSIDSSTINELLKRPELKSVLEKDRSAKELKLLDLLMEKISKDYATYGLAQVKEKLEEGNCESLLISENLIIKSRASDEKTFLEIEKLMNYSDSLNASLFIVSSLEASKKLDGLSGIALILKWKNYN